MINQTVNTMVVNQQTKNAAGSKGVKVIAVKLEVELDDNVAAGFGDDVKDMHELLESGRKMNMTTVFDGIRLEGEFEISSKIKVTTPISDAISIAMRQSSDPENGPLMRVRFNVPYSKENLGFFGEAVTNTIKTKFVKRQTEMFDGKDEE